MKGIDFKADVLIKACPTHFWPVFKECLVYYNTRKFPCLHSAEVRVGNEILNNTYSAETVVGTLSHR